MKRSSTGRGVRVGMFFLALGLLVGRIAPAQIGTAFTYQGQISQGGTAVTGTLDLEFQVYDALAGPTAVGPAVAVPDVAVSNGLFTVTLDFGGGVFDGDPRWLEIRVSPDFPTVPYTVLAPRQELTPTPYAIWSTDAASAVNAQNAVNATNAVNAQNADTLDTLDSTAFALASHTHPASQISGVADNLVAFGAGGGTALAGDAGGLSYDPGTNDLSGANAISSVSVGTTGAIAAGTTVTGATGVTATTGNVTAPAGDVTASGNVTASTGAVSAGTTVTAGTNVIATGLYQIGPTVVLRLVGTSNTFVGPSGNGRSAPTSSATTTPRSATVRSRPTRRPPTPRWAAVRSPPTPRRTTTPPSALAR